MERIEFQHAGETLVGTLCMPTKDSASYPGVIFFHGMTSKEDKYIPMAQALAEVGIAALTINIRGHGKSSGELMDFVAGDLETDGVVTYDFFVKQQAIDPHRIGIVGGSFGGLLAATTSEQREVKSIVLRAPATYTPEMRNLTVREIMERELEIFNEVEQPDETPAVRAMEKFTGSLLVIACEKDTSIPPAMTKAFFSAAKNAKRREFEILYGSEHSPQTEELRKQLSKRQVQWFLETL